MHESLTVFQTINSILEQSRLLVMMLKMDRNHIEKNNISLMEEANDKKIKTNNTLLNLIDSLNNNPDLSSQSGDFFERILSYAQSLSLKDQKELFFLLETLKTELPVYNQIMQVNRTIIHANLMRTKELFCAMLDKDPSHEPSIYKPSGLLAPV